jgi:hypothetical protein
MTSAGMSPVIAGTYVEMGNAINSGILLKILTSINLGFGEPPSWLTLQRNLPPFINHGVIE